MKSSLLCGRKGMGVLDVVISAAILVFVIFPVFSAVIEKYIFINTGQVIKDAIDITNLSAYNAIKADNLSRNEISFDNIKALNVYKHILSKNLNLSEELYPLPGSVAEGRVTIDSILLFDTGLPCTCPNGVVLDKPSMHCIVTVPVKPSLYRRVILELLGKEQLELKVHQDTDIPVNN